jgi:lipopolysaccharide biosynthesis protein
MPTELARPFHGARARWDFEATRPLLGTTLGRWRMRWTRVAAPAWRALRPVRPRARWILYFIHAPHGQLTPGQRFTLERLAREDAGLMLVCSCPAEDPLLTELKTICDALYWKDQPGWDFSAYAIGLHAVAAYSPGADLLLMNDSVYGPFHRLTPFIEQAPWRLSGFTGNAGNENHLQSYAMVFRKVDRVLLQYLAPVVSTAWSYNSASAVILLQETLLGRVASRHMSVGAWWYTDTKVHGDLCLHCPQQMIEAGFPFLKRSLVGKFAGVFQPEDQVRALLLRLGHPDTDP